MQTATETSIEAIFTFTDAEQEIETFKFDCDPSEAEVLAKLLSTLSRDQLRALVKISICQNTDGDALPWITDGKYHFHG